MQGVSELDQAKLPDLLDLNDHAVSDAVQALGNVAEIRAMIIEFQQHVQRNERDVASARLRDYPGGLAISGVAMRGKAFDRDITRSGIVRTSPPPS